MRVVLLTIVMVLLLATPAFAEHSYEHGVEMLQSLMDAYLPPGYGDATGIDGIDSFGVERHLYLYDLAAICQNYNGYYYWAGDGYYWHDCTGARH